MIDCNSSLTTLSVLGALLSGIFAACSYFQQKKVREFDIKEKYYSSIFDDYLVSYVPKARRKIGYKNGALEGFDELNKTFKKLLEDSQYFFFGNNEFYSELKEKIIDLEDYLIDTSNNSKCMFSEGQIFNEINEKIKNIYKCIDKNRFPQ